jgi:hypothetical protein
LFACRSSSRVSLERHGRRRYGGYQYALCGHVAALPVNPASPHWLETKCKHSHEEHVQLAPERAYNRSRVPRRWPRPHPTPRERRNDVPLLKCVTYDNCTQRIRGLSASSELGVCPQRCAIYVHADRAIGPRAASRMEMRFFVFPRLCNDFASSDGTGSVAQSVARGSHT